MLECRLGFLERDLEPACLYLSLPKAREGFVRSAAYIEHAHGEVELPEAEGEPPVPALLEHGDEGAVVFEPFFPGPGEYCEVQRHVALLALYIKFGGIFRAVILANVDTDMALGLGRGHYGGEVLSATLLLFGQKRTILFPDVCAVDRNKSFKRFHNYFVFIPSRISCNISSFISSALAALDSVFSAIRAR